MAKNYVNQEGTFRAEVTDYGLREGRDSTSQSLALEVEFFIQEIFSFEHNQWFDWTPHEMHVRGQFWIVKKDGNTNDRGIRSLVEALGWNGDLDALAQRTWQPAGPCQIEVKSETYDGKTRYRAEWLNAYDADPNRSVGNVTADNARNLVAKFSSRIRAVAVSIKPKANPVAAAPQQQAAASQPAPQPAFVPPGGPEPVAATSNATDDLPF